MELRQLEYFCKIADTGSVSEAARRRNMSQPPLSYQLRRLEEELNENSPVRYYPVITFDQSSFN